MLVTRVVSDRDPRIDRRRLEALGDQLGRIHALDPGDDVHTSRAAGSLPVEDLAVARSRLDAVADRLPPGYEPVHEALVDAIARTDDCRDLPWALVHADCHLGNVREDSKGGRS
ncbi:MAG: phosphotransferase [Actinomycetota bacterium]|nr:phosphotransferase [Actinomycetota bacterium]